MEYIIVSYFYNVKTLNFNRDPNSFNNNNKKVQTPDLKTVVILMKMKLIIATNLMKITIIAR